MKKTYIQPQTEIYDIANLLMLSASTTQMPYINESSEGFDTDCDYANPDYEIF